MADDYGSNWADIAALKMPMADVVSAYGHEAQQQGDWFFPLEGGKPYPVIMLLHGGCWLNKYDRFHLRPLARALSAQGSAVWLPEYRRVGDEGSGWPGTFADVLAAADHVATKADAFGLDLKRAIVMGHSAGGHLALWLQGWLYGAGQHEKVARLGLEFSRPSRILWRGAVGLAAIAELKAYWAIGHECAHSLPFLLGGDEVAAAQQWALADPAQLLPFSTAIELVHGTEDKIVPLSQSESLVSLAAGTKVQLRALMGASHFDVINPRTAALEVILSASAALLS